MSELILENGHCVGIRTEGGDEYRARRAVVSTIHVKRLVDMAPRAAWGEDFVFGVDTYHLGVPFLAAYFARGPSARALLASRGNVPVRAVPEPPEAPDPTEVPDGGGEEAPAP